MKIKEKQIFKKYLLNISNVLTIFNFLSNTKIPEIHIFHLLN